MNSAIKLYSPLLSVVGIQARIKRGHCFLAGSGSFLKQPSPTYLGVVLPTVGWTLLHQQIKRIPHRQAHRIVWFSQFFSWGSPSQVTLGCFKLASGTRRNLEIQSGSYCFIILAFKSHVYMCPWTLMMTFRKSDNLGSLYIADQKKKNVGGGIFWYLDVFKNKRFQNVLKHLYRSPASVS